jgi:hypothetical protein
MVYSSAPDPESVFAGWDGSSRSVSVALADGALYGFSSTTSDIIGITDGTGAVTPLGYIMTGGNYVATSQTVTFTNSTIALSGSTFTVTLGTPSNSTYLLTDAASHVATWSQYPTVFDQFGNGSTAATITGTTHVQF